MKKPFYRLVVSLITLAVLAAACYTVPETGRRGFSFFSPNQEISLGASAFEDIKRNEKISTDAAHNRRVQEVGRRIALQAEDHMPGVPWEFVVFDGDDTINAFALPGGKVGVYTGLLNLAESDDELAAVIGHEIAHVTARHGTERMSRAMAMAAAGIGLGAAVSGRDEQTQTAVLIAYGLGSTIGVELPHSRRTESEADEIGILYAARAGYDPRGAVRFWERMMEVSAGRASPPEFLSTHPSDTTRINNLNRLMPQAMEEYEKATGRRLN